MVQTRHLQDGALTKATRVHCQFMAVERVNQLRVTEWVFCRLWQLAELLPGSNLLAAAGSLTLHCVAVLHDVFLLRWALVSRELPSALSSSGIHRADDCRWSAICNLHWCFLPAQGKATKKTGVLMETNRYSSAFVDSLRLDVLNLGHAAHAGPPSRSSRSPQVRSWDFKAPRLSQSHDRAY